MAKKSVPYKVVCPALDAILLIKKYPPKKLQSLQATLKNKINSSDVPLEVSSYIDFLIDTFIVDVDNLRDIIKKEDEEGDLEGALYRTL